MSFPCDSIQKSAGNAAMKSHGYALDSTEPDLFTIEWQLLWQVKALPGYGPGIDYPNPLYAERARWSASPVWDPGGGTPAPVAYREKYRKKLFTRSVSWSYTDANGSSSSSATCSFSGTIGDPLCPVISGDFPGSNHNFDNVNFDPPVPGPTPAGPYDGSILFFVPPNFADDMTWDGYSANNSDGTTTEIINDGWTSEITFSSMLSKARSRIIARSFPTFLAGDVTNEGFSEFYSGVSTSPNPADYDGSPNSGGGSPGGIPSEVLSWASFGANPIANDGDHLGSFWQYIGNEEFTSGPASDTETSGLNCCRSRFRLTRSKFYFVAKARITPAAFGATPGITDIKFVSSGIAHEGEIIELPMPTSDNDFVSTNDEAGNATLTWGQITFAIIDESPAHWSARTGHVFS